MKHLKNFELFEETVLDFVKSSIPFVSIPSDDKLLKFLRDIPLKYNITNPKKKFIEMVKGQKLYHASKLENLESIKKNGLTNEYNYFLYQIKSDTIETPNIQVIVNTDSVINNLYPDPEMIGGFGMIQNLVKDKIDLDVLYWLFFNNLKDPQDTDKNYDINKGLSWVVVNRPINPDEIVEIKEIK